MVALQTRYQLLGHPDDVEALVDLGRERAADEPVRPEDAGSWVSRTSRGSRCTDGPTTSTER
ncbi:hypothetical protein SVIOM342S_10524 [Streptomyces violaceorubidus]